MDLALGRASISLLALLLSGNASAIGLGELRGQPVLGEGLRLEVALVGMEKQRLDASCFRLVQPATTDDLPWVRKATMSLRQAAGGEAVLQIHSEIPLREPIMQMRLMLGCGHEVSRDYVLMASPAREPAVSVAPVRGDSAGGASANLFQRRPVRGRQAVSVVGDEAPVRLMPRRIERRRALPLAHDRLILAGDDGGPVGE
ncbi:MAG: hypothetical protein KGP14_13110, partial [Betaproteobacteria bacterium]|nr:hypothetical protein [Betaproteobacteria bacterium]